jgi:hypothetical protein
MIFSFKRDRFQGTKQDTADRYFDRDSRKMRSKDTFDIDKWLARRTDTMLNDLTGAAADGEVNPNKRQRKSKKKSKDDNEDSSAEIISILEQNPIIPKKSRSVVSNLSHDDNEKQQTLMHSMADDERQQLPHPVLPQNQHKEEREYLELRRQQQELAEEKLKLDRQRCDLEQKEQEIKQQQQQLHRQQLAQSMQQQPVLVQPLQQQQQPDLVRPLQQQQPDLVRPLQQQEQQPQPDLVQP